MINKDRIVPATAQDLIGIYITGMNAFLLASSQPVLPCVAGEGMGEFEVADFAAGGVANEPIKQLNIGEATAATFFGVLDYDFDTEGFESTAENGTALEADGCTFYLISLASGTLTIKSTITGETWEKDLA